MAVESQCCNHGKLDWQPMLLYYYRTSTMHILCPAITRDAIAISISRTPTLAGHPSLALVHLMQKPVAPFPEFEWGLGMRLRNLWWCCTT